MDWSRLVSRSIQTRHRVRPAPPPEQADSAEGFCGGRSARALLRGIPEGGCRPGPRHIMVNGPGCRVYAGFALGTSGTIWLAPARFFEFVRQLVLVLSKPVDVVALERRPKRTQ
jgi:hypothetical protein